MFSCCNQSKSEVDILKERVEEMTRKINNIYELLEALTNESKKPNTAKIYLDKTVENAFKDKKV